MRYQQRFIWFDWHLANQINRVKHVQRSGYATTWINGGKLKIFVVQNKEENFAKYVNVPHKINKHTHSHSPTHTPSQRFIYIRLYRIKRARARAREPHTYWYVSNYFWQRIRSTYGKCTAIRRTKASFIFVWKIQKPCHIRRTNCSSRISLKLRNTAGEAQKKGNRTTLTKWQAIHLLTNCFNTDHQGKKRYSKEDRTCTHTLPN